MNKFVFGFLLVLASFLMSPSSLAEPNVGMCSGKFPNPLTDVCWGCLFPINIGPMTVTGSEFPNIQNQSPPLICTCPAPPPIFIRIGIGLGYWEPWKIFEAVRTPGCFPTLGGMKIGSYGSPAGTNKSKGGENGKGFYQVHMYDYPVLSWFFQAFSDSVCYNTGSSGFDLLYITELDPMWDDDASSFILMPEVVLFSNPIAQAACVADSVKATATRFGVDELFWCSGSQGSVFPLDGYHTNHVGGIDTSLAKVHSFLYKIHREGIAWDTSTVASMCFAIPQPLMRKGQYKQQMMHPVPQPVAGFGFGVASQYWGTGREFPFAGEDFSYLVWRKRLCCAL